MKRLLIMLALLAAALPLLAQAPSPSAPTSRTPANVRFMTCDVLTDCAQTPLAAWQIDIRASIEGGAVELVGIEGGKGVFTQPPHYDPEALTHNHIVLAAFSTAEPTELPRGIFRVARLHLRIQGGAGQAPEIQISLVAAAQADGAQFAPTFSSRIGDKQ